jgi:hypothetical protein
MVRMELRVRISWSCRFSLYPKSSAQASGTIGDSPFLLSYISPASPPRLPSHTILPIALKFPILDKKEPPTAGQVA